jgi:glutamyl-tRNA synthetase
MTLAKDRTVRVRFAPSPTGHLHIGSFRTALFNWLFARHNKGIFLVRIEDTDTERSTQEFQDSIMQALEWVDLKPDEPLVIQSERLARHQEVIKELLQRGNAYKCYCTQDDIKQRAGDNAFIKYDGTCRNAPPKDEPFVVRFKIPDEVTEVSFDDLIRGRVTIPRDQFDDFIIARSDGSPTYNFVVVVDDADMRITQVIRGEDHISNTPKQILLYRALGWQTPQFAHIPLILGPSGDRLSKRDGATSAIEYKQLGYLPDAMVNYLVRLGWAHGDQEVFTRQELIDFFTLKAVGKKGAIFDSEKLKWLNGVYMRESSAAALRTYICDELATDLPAQLSGWNENQIDVAIDLFKERVATLQELIHEVQLLHDGPTSYDQHDIEKWTDAQTGAIIDQIIAQFEPIASITIDDAKQIIKAIAKERECKMVAIAQPIRLALLGKASGPGVFEMIVLVGKKSLFERLKKLRASL